LAGQYGAAVAIWTLVGPVSGRSGHL